MNLFGLHIGWQQPIAETVDLSATFVGNSNPYNDDGQRWIAIGGNDDETEKSGVCNEQELFAVQAACRYFARKSPYCINGHANRISYIVGYGHTYTATVKKGQEASDEEVKSVQDAIDNFVRVNKWQHRQREIVRRFDRDGEVFLRYFPADGTIKVRFVEPSQVHVPDGVAHAEHESFGIKTDPNDVETIEAYCIDNNWVPAEEIQHRKANVDSNVKRGLPLFWPVGDIFKENRAIRRNMAAGSAIQTSYAMVKTVAGGSANGPSTLRGNASDFTRTNSATGKTDFFEEHKPGRIATKTDAVNYEFPFATTNYSAFVEVIQSSLREIASMLVMPEFMFTSDASNGNYASTMVAEGPAVRNFEGLQYEQREYDMEVLRRVVSAAGLPDDILDRVEIDVQCPQLAVRDPKAETDRRQVLSNNKILSPQTWAAEEGYDYQQEQENIEQHLEDHPDSMPMMPLDPNYDPSQDPNADPAQDTGEQAKKKPAKESIEGGGDSLLEFNPNHDPHDGKFSSGGGSSSGGSDVNIDYDNLRKLADHANAFNIDDDEGGRGEYLVRFNAWKKAMGKEVQALAEKYGFKSKTEDDRSGSSYLDIYAVDENGDHDDDVYQVRLSDHKQKYGGPGWSFRVDESTEQWKRGFADIEKELKDW